MSKIQFQKKILKNEKSMFNEATFQEMLLPSLGKGDDYAVHI